MEDREIDLLQLWHIIKSKLILILLISLIFAVGSYAFSRFVVVPKYRAETSLIISQRDNKTNITNDIQFNELKFNQELVDTYSEIIKTRNVSKIVIENLNLDISNEEFSSKVSVSPKNNTEIFSLSVMDTIPERALDIANETALVFKEAVKEIMKLDNVQILDEAMLPTKPVSPNIPRNTLLGAFLGLVLSTIVIIAKEILENTIKSSEQITELFNIPVLGVIPDGKRPDRKA